MNPQKADNDRLAYRVGRINLSGLTMTKVILWLVAITIVSFVIGFAILAVSGNLPDRHGKSASPFVEGGSLGNTSTIPLDGATGGRVAITLGAGEITVRGGAMAGNLIETTVYAKSKELQPEISGSMNGTQKIVTVKRMDSNDHEWLPGKSSHTWDIRVGETVPVDLTIELGAGDNSLELGSLDLAGLSVSTGAGDTEIDLTGYHGDPYYAAIHNGIGDLTLRFDKSSNTRITLHQGVGDITMNGIKQKDEYYTTPGFNPALAVNEITITQGIGSIQLEAE